ncbi:MAG TPA: hypothetical protein VGM90_40100 [Kofleriaceae bacterium]
MKRFALAISLGLSLMACGSKKPAPMEPMAGPGSGSAAVGGDPTCPLSVPGTSISVEDTSDGPALVFVTTGDETAVRHAGQALADAYNAHNGPPESLAMMFSQNATALTTPIDKGVKVVFAPKDAANAASVGGELRMHAQHLTGASSCEMKM